MIKRKKKKKDPRLFVTLGIIMMIIGTYAMLSCVMGGRLSAAESIALPFGFITVAMGAMLLTRSAIAVFFLFLYATKNLILNLVHEGIIDPANLIWICLIALCLPLIKLAQ